MLAGFEAPFDASREGGPLQRSVLGKCERFCRKATMYTTRASVSRCSLSYPGIYERLRAVAICSTRSIHVFVGPDSHIGHYVVVQLSEQLQARWVVRKRTCGYSRSFSHALWLVLEASASVPRSERRLEASHITATSPVLADTHICRTHHVKVSHLLGV